MTDLISAWGQLSPERPPYALAADLTVVGDSGRHAVTLESYEAYLEGGLEHSSDTRLHLGLLPQPWFGDLTNATVFILMLNPGLNPGDYFGEYRVPAFRNALVSNLRQEPGRSYPLLFLDPEFSWHPGARYFRARFHWLADAIAKQHGHSYHESLAMLSLRICCLQSVPYHSVRYGLPEVLRRRLQSSKLAVSFVHDGLLSRPGTLIIVTRGPWGLTERENVIVYRGGETRAAHLSPGSRGGKALAVHFGLGPR